MNRRELLVGAGSLAVAAALPVPALPEAPLIGRVIGLASDGGFWVRVEDAVYRAAVVWTRDEIEVPLSGNMTVSLLGKSVEIREGDAKLRVRYEEET